VNSLILKGNKLFHETKFRSIQLNLNLRAITTNVHLHGFNVIDYNIVHILCIIRENNNAFYFVYVIMLINIEMKLTLGLIVILDVKLIILINFLDSNVLKIKILLLFIVYCIVIVCLRRSVRSKQVGLTNDIKLNDRKLFIRFFSFLFLYYTHFCSNYARVIRHTCPIVQKYNLALGLYYLPAVKYEHTKNCL